MNRKTSCFPLNWISRTPSSGVVMGIARGRDADGITQPPARAARARAASAAASACGGSSASARSAARPAPSTSRSAQQHVAECRPARPADSALQIAIFSASTASCSRPLARQRPAEQQMRTRVVGRQVQRALHLADGLGIAAGVEGPACGLEMERGGFALVALRAGLQQRVDARRGRRRPGPSPVRARAARASVGADGLPAFRQPSRQLAFAVGLGTGAAAGQRGGQHEVRVAVGWDCGARPRAASRRRPVASLSSQ